MSEKKKPSKTGGSASSARLTLQMRLDPATDAALNAFIGAQRVPPDKTAVGLIALHEFLAREGFWPPDKATG